MYIVHFAFAYIADIRHIRSFALKSKSKVLYSTSNLEDEIAETDIATSGLIMAEYFSKDCVCLDRCYDRLTCLKAKEMKTEYKRSEDKEIKDLEPNFVKHTW